MITAGNENVKQEREKGISGFFCRQPKQLTMVIVEEGTEIPDPKLSFLPPFTQLSTYSNGLLCCLGQTATPSKNIPEPEYIICNPVTKTYKILKKPDHHGVNPNLVLVTLPEANRGFKLMCPILDLEEAPEGFTLITFDMLSCEEEASSGDWTKMIEGHLCEAGTVLRCGIHDRGGVVYWAEAQNDGLIIKIDSTRRTLLKPIHTNNEIDLSDESSMLLLIQEKLSVARLCSEKLVIKTNANEEWQTTYTVDLKFMSLDLNTAADEESAQTRQLLFVNHHLVVFQDATKTYCYNRETRKIDCLTSGVDCMEIPYMNSLVEFKRQ